MNPMSVFIGFVSSAIVALAWTNAAPPAQADDDSRHIAKTLTALRHRHEREYDTQAAKKLSLMRTAGVIQFLERSRHAPGAPWSARAPRCDRRTAAYALRLASDVPRGKIAELIEAGDAAAAYALKAADRRTAKGLLALIRAGNVNARVIELALEHVPAGELLPAMREFWRSPSGQHSLSISAYSAAVSRCGPHIAVATAWRLAACEAPLLAKIASARTLAQLGDERGISLLVNTVTSERLETSRASGPALEMALTALDSIAGRRLCRITPGLRIADRDELEASRVVVEKWWTAERDALAFDRTSRAWTTQPVRRKNAAGAPSAAAVSRVDDVLSDARGAMYWSTESDFPYSQALARQGRPAIPALVARLRRHPPWIGRDISWEVDICASALAQILETKDTHLATLLIREGRIEASACLVGVADIQPGAVAAMSGALRRGFVCPQLCAALERHRTREDVRTALFEWAGRNGDRKTRHEDWVYRVIGRVFASSPSREFVRLSASLPARARWKCSVEAFRFGLRTGLTHGLSLMSGDKDLNSTDILRAARKVRRAIDPGIRLSLGEARNGGVYSRNDLDKLAMEWRKYERRVRFEDGTWSLE